LHRLPTADRFQVLSVGCGTGVWAIEMADRYPNAEVVSIDLTQPMLVSDQPNYHPLWDVDINDECWGSLQEGSFDFVRIGMVCGRVEDWRRLLRTAFW
jgi:2-polyprenyl-3-methyl-5-hydroxy-6-metoxy-1,4-benzoquinol methylase